MNVLFLTCVTTSPVCIQLRTGLPRLSDIWQKRSVFQSLCCTKSFQPIPMTSILLTLSRILVISSQNFSDLRNTTGSSISLACGNIRPSSANLAHIRFLRSSSSYFLCVFFFLHVFYSLFIFHFPFLKASPSYTMLAMGWLA